MITKVAIIGAGGQARETLDIFEACNAERPAYDVLGFIVDAEYGLPGTLVNGKPILGDFSWLAAHAGEVSTLCAVGAPEQRRQLVARAEAVHAQFCNAIHPSAVLTRWVELGQGIIIAAGCVVTNQIRIGHHAQINYLCSVGHDCTLADLATLGPGVRVAGNVTVAVGAYIGTGVNIIQKIRIGEWSVIGAGSTVISDVPPNTTVVGVPGRVIKTRPPGWQVEMGGQHL